MDTSPQPNAPRTVYLDVALNDLPAWVAYFRNHDIPVLESTSQALEALREHEETVNANALAEVIRVDPLMTVKFMAYVAGLRRDADNTETETVTSALVMSGIPPFFRRFGPQPTIEDQLLHHPKALALLREMLRRAERAAHFAMAFAVHRSDTDAGVIHEAAFLHDFAEMLLLCHAPALLVKIRRAQQADPTLRSSVIQREVLNIEINDLRQALLKIWRLPELLIRISDGKHDEHPSVRSVELATRLARHTAHGWDNAALPDDINDLAQLLNASPRVALAFLRKVDLGSGEGGLQPAPSSPAGNAAEGTQG